MLAFSFHLRPSGDGFIQLFAIGVAGRMLLASVGIRPHIARLVALVESVMSRFLYLISPQLTASTMAAVSASWGVCFLLMRKSQKFVCPVNPQLWLMIFRGG